MRREVSRLYHSRRRTQYEVEALHRNKTVIERLPIKKRAGEGSQLAHLSDWQFTERDARSSTIDCLVAKEIRLVNHLEASERATDGFERINRLRRSLDIPLCVDAFLAIWENPGFFPEEWSERHTGNHVRHIFFDGAILTAGLFSEPFTPYLFASRVGIGYGFYPLSLPRHAQDLSAVI